MTRKLKFPLLLIGVATGLILLFILTGAQKAGQNVSRAGQQFSELVGKPAPEFALPDQRGQTAKLSDYKGRKVILFFSEGVMCYPACWDEMAALGNDPELNNQEVATMSIINDPAEEWAQAIAKMPALDKERTLFDLDNTVSEQYGALLLPSSMHKGQKPGHSYVVIDTQGIVRYVLDDPKMGKNSTVFKEEMSKF